MLRLPCRVCEIWIGRSRGVDLRKKVLVLAIAASLSACAVADTIAQDQAKTVVNNVVQERFPGVDATPVTDCVIEAASAGEIVDLAQDSATGISQSTVLLVVEIAARPESVECIADNGLTLLGG